MTNEQWVQDINAVIGKTREHKVDWQLASDGQYANASIGAYTLSLAFRLRRNGAKLEPTTKSLTLRLLNAAGAILEVVSESEDEPVNKALHGLFKVSVAEPHEKALAEFHTALSDL